MEKIRIIVVDDHQIVREGIVAVLARESDFEIVGEGSNGAEAINLVRQRKPDVALMDAQMPGLSGAETIKSIGQMSPRTHVIVLSMHDSEYIVLQMLRAGARSYLLKGAKSGEVVQAIRDTMRGASYLSPAIARTVLDTLTYAATSRGGEEDLTAREHEVLRLMAAGKTSREIAEQLNLSAKTVQNCRTGILRKLNARNQVEAIATGIQRKILPVPGN